MVKEKKTEPRVIHKNELGHFFNISKEGTNSEMFVLCRKMQDGAFDQGVMVSNLAEVYWWLIEWRDSLIEEGKKKSIIKKNK